MYSKDENLFQATTRIVELYIATEWWGLVYTKIDHLEAPMSDKLVTTDQGGTCNEGLFPYGIAAYTDKAVYAAIVLQLYICLICTAKMRHTCST